MKAKAFKFVMVLLFAALVAFATLWTYTAIKFGLAPWKIEGQDSSTLIIGVVSPDGSENLFTSAGIRLPDGNIAIKAVLYDFTKGKSYEPEDLGLESEKFTYGWKNIYWDNEVALDGVWPRYLGALELYNAYLLTVKYTGEISGNYNILSNAIRIVCASDSVRHVSQFQEEKIYAYPGEECVFTLQPEFPDSDIVLKTYGNVGNTVVVRKNGIVIAASYAGRNENVVRFVASGTVSVTVKNVSDVNEAFNVYAGYESLSDYIGAENGMDLALKAGETRYIQIDDEFDDNLMPTYNEFNVYDVFVNAAPSISFKVYDMMTGSDPFAEFSGEEGTIRNSFICNFPSPLVVAITNNSDSEKSINVVIKRSDAVDFTDTTAESVTVFDTCALLIKIPSPGTLKLVCDRILNEDVYVAALNARCEVLSTKMLTDETQISINGNAAFLWIINRGNPKFGLMAEFIPD